MLRSKQVTVTHYYCWQLYLLPSVAIGYSLGLAPSRCRSVAIQVRRKYSYNYIILTDSECLDPCSYVTYWSIMLALDQAWHHKFCEPDPEYNNLWACAYSRCTVTLNQRLPCVCRSVYTYKVLPIIIKIRICISWYMWDSLLTSWFMWWFV